MNPAQAVLSIAFTSIMAARASAEVRVQLSGSVSADIRARVQERRFHDLDDGELLLDKGISRNENRIRARVEADSGGKVKAVGELEFAWLGFSEVVELEGLSRSERVDPYWLEAHAAYLDVYEIVPKLDLRLGRQIVEWGTADQFNPTDNLNPSDLYDPLAFGVNLANQMVRVDWYPWGDLSLTAVWVPVFRPARLPDTAVLGLASTERIPIQDAQFRQTTAGLASLQGSAGIGPTGLVVLPNTPDPAFDNSQAGVRLRGRAGVFDLSASYYIGRDDIPQAYLSDISNLMGDAIIRLMYPRKQVVGADMAASLPWLADIGVWAEGALVFPQEVTLNVVTPDGQLLVDSNGGFCSTDPLISGLGGPDLDISECDSGAHKPIVVSGQPFPQWTVGGDYSFRSGFYFNLQWVHGFVDEFGSGVDVRVAAVDPAQESLRQRISDYVVFTLDHKSHSDSLLLRLAPMFELRDASAVVFPQVIWTVWDGAELTTGAFIKLGSFDTKFGDPAAGSTELFMRGKMYF